MIDYNECAALDGEYADKCAMMIDHCDFNNDGAVDGCEFIDCLHWAGA